MNTIPAAMDIRAAGQFSGLSRSRLYVLAGRGEIEMIKAGRRTLIKTKSLQDAIDRLPAAKIRPQN